MYNARRIPFSNLSSVEKVFHLKSNASARDLLSTQTHSIWLKGNKLSNNVPVKPLAEAKKKNHRMKSQLNMSKSLLEDMDEHAPIMSPIASSYIPCHQKQLTAHMSTNKLPHASIISDTQQEIAKYTKKECIAKPLLASTYKSRSAMSARNASSVCIVNTRYFSNSNTKRANSRIGKSPIQRKFEKPKTTAKLSRAKSDAGNLKVKKQKLLLNDSTADQFDVQQTIKENNIKHVRIEKLTQQLQAMKELNHFLRMQLNFIVGAKL